jgi:hypothetical protein
MGAILVQSQENAAIERTPYSNAAWILPPRPPGPERDPGRQLTRTGAAMP